MMRATQCLAVCLSVLSSAAVAQQPIGTGPSPFLPTDQLLPTEQPTLIIPDGQPGMPQLPVGPATVPLQAMPFGMPVCPQVIPTQMIWMTAPPMPIPTHRPSLAGSPGWSYGVSGQSALHGPASPGYGFQQDHGTGPQYQPWGQQPPPPDAYIEVFCRAGTEIWINDQETSQIGARRTYRSPMPDYSKRRYKLTAVAIKGLEYEYIEKWIELEPGEREYVFLDMRAPAPDFSATAGPGATHSVDEADGPGPVGTEERPAPPGGDDGVPPSGDATGDDGAEDGADDGADAEPAQTDTAGGAA